MKSRAVLVLCLGIITWSIIMSITGCMSKKKAVRESIPVEETNPGKN